MTETRNIRDLPMLTSVPAGAVFAVQGSSGVTGKMPLEDLIIEGLPGDPGEPGLSAKLLVVGASRREVRYDALGVASPVGQTIVFTAKKQNSVATVSWAVFDATGALRLPATNFLSSELGDNVTMTEAQFNSARNDTSGVIIQCALTDGEVLSDTISVVRLQDGVAGADAVVGYLTNEAHTLPADASGAILSYAGAAGSLRVFKGQTDVSPLFALSTLANPQALTVAYAGQDYTINAGYDAGEVTATLTIRATGSGAMAGVFVDKVFSLAKSRSGSNGAPGDPGNPGLPGDPGEPGEPGAPGTNGLSATLNPPSLPIACFANGVVKPDAFTGLSAQFEIFSGAALQTAGWTFSIVSGLSIASSGTVSASGLVTPTAVSDDDAYLVARAINGAIVIDRTLRLPKIRDGGSGVSKSVDITTLPTSSTFLQVAQIEVEIPPQISISISGGAGYLVNGAGNYTPNMKLMLQDVTAGGAPFDVSSTNVFGSTAFNTGGVEPEFFDGSVSASAVVANSSTAPKVMRLLVMVRRSGGGQSVAVTFGRATISAGG